jgi:heterodisulfide reductase subunit C
MTHEMDLMPREVLRLLQLGQYQRVLGAKTVWVCANCSVCSARCPQNVDIASLMLEVRRTAKQSGRVAQKEPDIFDDIFVDNIRRYGKSNEAILAMKYNLKSGHLFQDALNAPKMAARGMIGPKLHKVKDRAAVRALVEKILQEDSKEGSGHEPQA